MAPEDQLAECAPGSSLSWMVNADGRSPCTVASYLMQQCSSTAELRVLPINSTMPTYTNPQVGQWCTCNSVVYNLMSACAVCQGGRPVSYSTWTESCIDVSDGFPDQALARKVKTPRWAYSQLSRRGTFAVDSAEEAVSSEDSKWTPMQIALPVIVAVAVVVLAVLAFYLYRRRVKRRYAPLHETHPSPGLVQRSQLSAAASVASLNTHKSYPSESSMSKQVPKRKKSAVTVAWEHAKLQGPRKLGGLIADRAKVHARTKSEIWTIDADSDLGHRSNSSGLHSKEGTSEAPSSSHVHHQARSSQTSLLSSVTRLAKHGRSESQVGLLSPESNTPSSPPTRSGRDSPAYVKTSPNALSRIMTGIAGHFREQPVPVVNGTPRRGFNLDDVDAQSPITAQHHRDSVISMADAVVNGEQQQQQQQQTRPRPDMMVSPRRGGLPLNPLRTALPITRLSTIPSRHGSEESTEAVVNAGRDEAFAARYNGQQGDNNSPDVLLISHIPGQDFNSVATPLTGESDGLAAYQAASTESSEQWSAALSDLSSVMHPSFARATVDSPVLAPIPHPYNNTPLPRRLPQEPQSQASQTVSPSPPAFRAGSLTSPALTPVPEPLRSPPSQYHEIYTQATPRNLRSPPLPSSSSTPTPQQWSGIPHGAALPRSPGLPAIPLIFPSESRVNSPPQPPPLHISPVSRPPISLNTRQSRQYDRDEPPSAYTHNTHNTGHSSQANAGSTQSEHSSSYAYTVPNPFVYDASKGGARTAATALRFTGGGAEASPDPERTGGRENANVLGVAGSRNPFRRERTSSFDLAE